MIIRPYLITQFDYFFLDPIQVFLGQAGRRQNRSPLFGLNPNKDVSTSPIMKIIGKGAQGVQDGLRVPALLNSSRSHSTKRPLRISLMLMDKGIRFNSPSDYCGLFPSASKS